MKLEEIYEYYTALKICHDLSGKGLIINLEEDDMGNFITIKDVDKTTFLEIVFYEEKRLVRFIISKMIKIPNYHLKKIILQAKFNIIWNKKISLLKEMPFLNDSLRYDNFVEIDNLTFNYNCRGILDICIKLEDISDEDFHYINNDLLKMFDDLEFDLIKKLKGDNLIGSY